MSFRFAALALALILSTSGCGVGEGPASARPQRPPDTEIECLNDMKARLTEYFEGKATDAEVKSIFACINTGVAKFRELTRGQTQGRYTAEELRNFFQTYFLDFTVSDAFLKEIMKLKKELLGGDMTQFHDADLDRLTEHLGKFESMFLDLRPYMPFNVDRFERASYDHVNGAGKALERAAKTFSELISGQNTSYGFDDLDRLSAEILKEFPGADSLRTLRRNKDRAVRLKKKLISPTGSGTTVNAAEWKIILTEGAKWAGIFLKFCHLDRNYPDWSMGTGRVRLMEIATAALANAKPIVKRHGKQITFASLNGLIDELPWDNGFMGISLKRSSVKTILKPTIQKLLGGVDTSTNGRAAKGLTVTALDRLQLALNEWSESTRYLEGLYKRLSGQTPKPSMAYSADQLLGVTVANALASAGGANDLGKQMGEDLRKVIQPYRILDVRPSGYPAMMSGTGKGILFDGTNLSRAKAMKDLLQHAWIRPLFRRVLRGYMTGPALATRAANLDKGGLTLEEFIQLNRDFWPILVDFNLVAEHNTPEIDGHKRFREASLFTFQGDGDPHISIDEGAQLLLFLISSHPRGNLLHETAAKHCQNGPDDAFGKPTIEPKCYRKWVLDFDPNSANAQKLWGAYPLFLKYFGTLTKKQREELLVRIEDGSRKDFYQENVWFGSTDTDTLSMLVHYVEAVYLRYDISRNGALEHTEAMRAFETFKYELSDISGFDLGKKRLKTVFTFLLDKAEAPISCKMNFVQKVAAGVRFYSWHLKGWKRQNGQWVLRGWNDLSADRSQLYGVLGSIGKIAREEEECKLAEELDSHRPGGDQGPD